MAGGPNPEVVKKAQAEARLKAQEELATAQEDQPWLDALDGASAELGSELDTNAEQDRAARLVDRQRNTPEFLKGDSMLLRGVDAFFSGGYKALFETKDTLMGETNFEDKSQFRKDVEAESANLDRLSVGYGITGDIGQFVTGLMGAGKVLAPLKSGAKLDEAGKLAKWTYETGKAALVGATVFDPHEERLSNLVQRYPSLANPVTAYLAADPEDSNAEGRIKSAIESIGLDAGISVVFAGSLKALKLMRSGDTEAAKAVTDKITKQVQEARDIQSGSMRDNIAKGQDVPPAAPVAASDLKPGDMRSKTMKELQAQEVKPTGKDVPGAGTKGKKSKGSTIFAEEAPNVTRDPAAFKEAPTPLKDPKEIADADVQKLIEASDVTAAGQMKDQSGASWAGRGGGAVINWTKTHTVSEAAIYTQRVAKVLEERINKIKGGDVLTDRVVAQRVSRMVDAFGLDPAATLGSIRADGKAAVRAVASSDAGFTIGSSIMADVHDLSRKIKYGMLDEFGGDTAKAVLEITRRATIGIETLGAAQSIVSNSGRTLRRQRAEFKINPKNLEKLKKMMGDANFVEMIYQSDGDITKLIQLGDQTLGKRIGDTALQLLVNGPLWWWPTHVVNLTSSAMMLAVRPAEMAIGGVARMAVDGPAGRDLMKKAAREFRYTFSGVNDGLRGALDAYIAGDSVMAPHDMQFGEVGAAGNALPVKPFTSIDNVIHNAMIFAKPTNIIGQPTRVLGAADELMKRIRYRAVVMADAAAQAEKLGLSGADAKSHIKRELEASFAPSGEALNAGALREARVGTFSDNLGEGTLGKSLQNLVSAHPYLLRPTFTYIRTPIKAFRYAMKMTPGLNAFQAEFRNALLGKMGVEEQAHAIGQMSMGALISAYAMNLAASGMLTGAGPSDPKLRTELVARGWKPYSYIYENEDGSKSYWPIGRMEPLGTIFGIAADLDDLEQHPEKRETSSDLAGAMLVAITQNVMNKTFLQSVAGTVRALQDPEKSMGKMVGNTLEAMIPGSALLRGTNPDPYLRDARTLVDNALDTMPGYSKTLPPKRDIYGDPMVAQRGLWSNSDPDPVEQEVMRIMLDTGHGFSPVQPVRDGVDLRDLKLEDGRTAYDKLQEVSGRPTPKGMTLKQALGKAMAPKAYGILPDGEASIKGTKSNVLSGVIANFREAGYKRLLHDSPMLREAVNARKLEVTTRYRENVRKARAESAAASKNPLETLQEQLNGQ